MLVNGYVAENKLFIKKEIACYYKKYKCNAYTLALSMKSTPLI